MASITVRNLDEDLKQRLRTRAAANGVRWSGGAEDSPGALPEGDVPVRNLGTAIVATISSHRCRPGSAGTGLLLVMTAPVASD